jgi:hypothetical protein
MAVEIAPTDDEPCDDVVDRKPVLLLLPVLRNNPGTVAFGYVGAPSEPIGVGAEEAHVAENGKEAPEDSQSAG